MNPATAPQGPLPPRGGSSSAPGALTGERFTEAVLATVEAIPPGQVLAYGDIAELLGAGGPRQVGRVLSLHGGTVPWWRVTRANGAPPPGQEAIAEQHWRAERTPLRAPGRVDMGQARWDGGHRPAG